MSDEPFTPRYTSSPRINHHQIDTLSVHLTIKDVKPLELTFFKSDTVNEVFQAVEVVPEAHHYTNYNLVYQSEILDPITPLADLLSSVKQKILQIELKPKPYDGKAILEHLNKTRDIVGLTHPETYGLQSGVSKINELDLSRIPEAKVEEPEKKDEDAKATYPELSPEEATQASQLVSTFFNKLPANYYTSAPLIQPAVRGLYLSAWNPVPINYVPKGHLIYILLQTLEGETFNITGSTRGFFINKTSTNKFDPNPRETSNHSYTLYELISKTSKNFVGQIKSNNAKLEKIDPITFLRPQTSFLSNPWITKALNPTSDFGKTQFQDQTQRDFNDEYQSIKDFSSQTLSDRIIRERLLAKTAFEFTETAVKGALDVLNGSIQPMNPSEKKLDQIFLHNGVFYSFGVDASGFFEPRGGNNAARASYNQDLKAIKYWNTVDPRGVYTLLTTIVDFAGKRVVCQSPVPGLFTSSEPKEVKNEETGETELVDGEALTRIDYGFDDSTNTFKSNPEFITALEPIRKAIHYKKVKTESGEGEAVTNFEIKGMVGTDRRKYVLDLFNTTPLDVEFTDEHYHPEKEDSYPHRQIVTRLEAVQEWWAHEAKKMIKEEAEKQGIDLSAPLKDGEEPPSVTIDDDKLLFTPDRCQTDENVRSLSKFIKSELVPRFLEQYDTIINVIPTDGSQFSSNLQKHGVNLRYLGYVAQQIEERIISSEKEEAEQLEKNKEINQAFDERKELRAKKIDELIQARTEALKKGEEPAADDLEKLKEEEQNDFDQNLETKPISKPVQYRGVHAIAIQEMIARASKHILRDYSLTLRITLVPLLVSHFHNCLLGEDFNSSPKADVENSELYTAEELSFTKLTPKSVKELIVKNVKIWYRYDLPSDWNVKFIKPLQLQREIALKFGIQWQAHEYFFTKEDYETAQKSSVKEKKSKKGKSNSPTPTAPKLNVFEPEDVSFAPLVKDSVNRSTAAEQIFEAGRQTLQNGTDEGKREEGLALMSEALSVYEQVYGQVHPEVGRVYATLSQIYQEIGLKREATLFARRAVAVHERTSGLDSHETLIALLNLGYLEAESGSIINSLKVYALLTQVWSSVYGSQHISIPTVIVNASLFLQNSGASKDARISLEKLIELSIKVHGEDSYATGYLKFRRAFSLAQESRFEEAFNEAQACHQILRKVVSEQHFLAQQARYLSEQMNRYKLIQTENQRIEKQKLKALAKQDQENAKASKVTNGKSNTPNKKFDQETVESILNFINASPSSGNSKKNKNKNKKN